MALSLGYGAINALRIAHSAHYYCQLRDIQKRDKPAYDTHCQYLAQERELYPDASAEIDEENATLDDLKDARSRTQGQREARKTYRDQNLPQDSEDGYKRYLIAESKISEAKSIAVICISSAVLIISRAIFFKEVSSKEMCLNTELLISLFGAVYSSNLNLENF